jgi:hypothetical protein
MIGWLRTKGFAMTVERFALPRPDDWHLHVRDGAALAAVVPHTAAVFGRALIMPNLKPPVTTVAAALAYRERILSVVRTLPGAAARFEPIMTLYLTETTTVTEIDRAAATQGRVRAVKLYPAGATTNAESGVRCIERVYPVLERMEARGIVLCVHGEVTDPEIDLFDREAVFIERVLDPIVRRFPGLKVVLEHITTAEKTLPRRSLRTTCFITAMRFSKAGYVPTTTACRCSSGSSIGRRSFERLRVATPNSFWVPIRHPMRAVRKRPSVGAQAVTRRTPRCRCTHKRLRPSGRSIGYPISRHASAPHSTVSRRQPSR